MKIENTIVEKIKKCAPKVKSFVSNHEQIIIDGMILMELSIGETLEDLDPKVRSRAEDIVSKAEDRAV